MRLRCDLDIEDSEPIFFRTAHHLMIIRHHNKFGLKKWLSGSGDTERTRSETRSELRTDKVIAI